MRRVLIESPYAGTPEVVERNLRYLRAAGWWSTLEGPDCRAILVPEGEGRLSRIADYIGITVISMSPADTSYGRRRAEFRPFLPDGKKWACEDWHEWAPTRRVVLPEYVPDVAAGSSAPLQLTAWKIAAIKIAVTIELRGYVTRDDFKHIEIDHRRWITNEWLRTENGRWVAHRPPDFKAQHPRVYAEIKADFEKWAPPELPVQAGRAT